MKLPRTLTYLATTSAIAGSIAYSAYLGYRVGSNAPLKEYVAKHAGDLFDRQMKELGIRLAWRPKIKYVESDDIPGTYYDDKEDTIWIDSIETISPESTLENFITRQANKYKQIKRHKDLDGSEPEFSVRVFKADESLWHEFGHSYLTKLRQSYGISQPEGSDRFRAMEINEGIAEYFERRMTKNETQEPHDSFRYLPYKLLRPIVDKHGEKGMACMAANLKERDESLDIYQKRILDLIEKDECFGKS